MISATVRVRGGLLRAVRLSGHAGIGPKGTDPVCAGVTVLVRSVARLLAEDRFVAVRGEAPAEGSLGFDVESVAAEKEEWLEGVTSLLLQGLRDIAAESPTGLQLTEQNE